MRRAFRFLAASVLLSCAHPPAPTPQSFDRAGWVSDLDQLEGQLGTSYPNLAWNVDHRRLNVAALDRRTRARIARASRIARRSRRSRAFSARSAIRTSRPSPEGQPGRRSARYGVRVRTDGREVVIAKFMPGACPGAATGDRVERLEGRPPPEWIADNRELSNTSNPPQAAMMRCGVTELPVRARATRSAHRHPRAEVR